MADIQSNIDINIDTSNAVASIKVLQSQISAFQTAMSKSSATNAAVASGMQQNLISNINATNKFEASLRTVKTTTESFTTSLEKNKLSLGQYFRYSVASSRTFGSLFTREFNTINKVARERVKDLQTTYVQMGRDANGAMKAVAIRPLMLDLESLGTKTQIAAQRQQLLNQLLKQGSTNLLNFGKNTQWAGRQLMVGFTIPLAMAGAAAAKAYMAIEEASIKLRRVYGDLSTTTEETDAMVSSVRRLAEEYTKYGIAVAETMDMAAKAAAMGKTGADLLAQVSEASRLSALGGVKQEQALETTISLTNAFGLSAEKLAAKINFLNAVENQTVTSIEDLTIAIPKAGPVVQQLGGDVEDLTFFLTAMREGGINASEGANALKSGLAALINPTGKAADMLAGFGINVKEIVESNKGDLKSTVVEFAQALDTLDPLNRARAIEQMFGKFQFARLSTLFKNVTTEGTQASKTLALANMSAIQLAAMSERELSKIESSPMYKFQKAITELQSKIAPIGETFLKAITPVIDGVGKVLDGVNGMGEGFKQFLVVGTAVVGGLAPVILMLVGLVANGAANIIKLFANIKSLFNGANTSSQVLGETTSYLTMEQIKAEAVAASLDQVHTKLTQTFTSEASAINLVTAALARQVAAQNRNLPAAGLPGYRRNLAGGGYVSGPGTGTSDSIPAMLSDGEFVMPAKQTKRFLPLLQGMVAGNLPGFKFGGRVGSGPQGRPGKSDLTISEAFGKNVSKTGANNFGNIDPNNMMFTSSIYAQEILDDSKVTVAQIDKETDAWRLKNKQMLDAAETAYESGIPAAEAFSESTKKFRTDMEAAQGPVSKFTASAKKLAPKLSQDLAEAQDAVKRLGLNVNNGADMLRLQEELPSNIAAKKANTPASFQRRAKTRSASLAMFADPSQFEEVGIPRVLSRNITDTKSRMFGGLTSQGHITTNVMQERHRESLRQLRATGTQAMNRSVDDAFTSAKKNAKIKSPSERASSEIGKPIVAGVAKGIQEGSPMVEKALAQSVDGAIKKTSRRVSRQQGSPGASISQSGARPGPRRSGTQEGYFENGVFIPTMNGNPLAPGMSSAPLGPSKPTRLQRLRSGFQDVKSGRKQISGAKISGAGFGASIALGLGSMLPGAGGQIAGTLAPIIGVLSMFGGAISKILPMLIRFAGPIGLAITAIGGLVAITNEANKAKQKELDEINRTSNAYKNAESALEAFGRLTGTSPQADLKSLAATGVGTANAKQASDVSILLGSQDFKDKNSDVGKVISGIKEMSNAQATAFLQTYANRLKAAGFSEDNLNSLITALQMAAGKTSLKLEFKDISYGSKAGISALENNVSDAVSNYQKSVAKGQQAKVSADSQISGMDPFGWATKEWREKTKKNILGANTDYQLFKTNFQDLKSSIGTNVSSMVQQLMTGGLSIGQYTTALDTMRIGLSNLSAVDRSAMLSGIMLNADGKSIITPATLGVMAFNEQLGLLQMYYANPKSAAALVAEINKGGDAALAARKKLIGFTPSEVKTTAIDYYEPPKSGGTGGTKKNTPLQDLQEQLKEAQRLKTFMASGLNPEFAELLSGLDKADRAKYLTSNNKLNKQGKELQKTYNTKVLTDFNNSQTKILKSFDAEIKTKDQLILLGVDYITASKAATDADVQQAITAAMLLPLEKDRIKRLKEIARLLKLVAEATDKSDFQKQKDEQYSAIQAASDQVTAYNKLVKAGMSLADAYELVQDSALAASLANSKVASDEDVKAYILAARKIAVLAEKLKDPNQRIIDNAQKQIAVYESQATTYQTALGLLQAKEEKINETYDKRIEALDKVLEANEAISQQQKDQLDLADALSRGDIAAAAKSAADIRARTATDSVEQQKKILEDAKAAQVKALTITVGNQTLTMKMLTDKITELEGKISKINLEVINPAQEKIAQQELNNIITDAEINATQPNAPIDPNPVINTPIVPPIVPPIITTKVTKVTNDTSGTKFNKTPPQTKLPPREAIDFRVPSGTTKNKPLMSGVKAGNGASEWSLVGNVVNKAVDTAVKGVSSFVGGFKDSKIIKGVSSIFGSFGRVLGITSANGGVVPQYLANGGTAQWGKAVGTDTIPAMLTPGEFVVRKYAVDKFGVDNLKAINSGASISDSVYNYDINISVKSESNANDIANTVIQQIKRIDDQRLKGNRLNAN